MIANQEKLTYAEKLFSNYPTISYAFKLIIE